MEINTLTITAVLFCAVLSGFLYWVGGETGWDTKWRDWGCNTVAVALAWLLAGEADGSLVVAWFLLWGALTTYWKGEETDCQWYHWLFTGLGYGASFVFFASNTGHLGGWFLYTVVLGASTSAWSVNTYDVRVEAGGRGALICLLMPLMFLW
jgi:hypothetical protein